MRRVTSIFLVFSLIICALGLFSCKDGSTGSTKEDTQTVLRINGIDVSYEMLRYAAMNVLNDRLSRGYSVPDGTGDDVREQNAGILAEATDALCVTYGAFALAQKYGIDPFGESVTALAESKLAEKAAEYDGDEAFRDGLAASFMTRNVLLDLLRYEAVYSEIFEKMLSDGVIETNDDALRAIFDSDAFRRIKILCFSTERHTIAECRALADTAAADLEAGADFDEYVKSHGEMLSMFANPDGIYICRGIWEKPLEDTAFSLAIGEISEPIESADGVRILLREEKSAVYLKKNFDTLRETYEEGVFRIEMETAVDNARSHVEKTDKFNEISVFGMKMGK